MATDKTPEGWEWMSLRSVFRREAVAVAVEPTARYREIGIRSHGKGVFHKEEIIGAALGAKRVFQVVPGALALNIVFAWEGAVAVMSERERGMIASHRFPMYVPKDSVDVEFVKRYFQTRQGVERLGEASPGGAGRNRTLNQKLAAEIQIPVPPLGEQRKIAAILGSIDDAIVATQAVIDQLQVVKDAVARELLTRGLPGRHTRFEQTVIGEMPDSWKLVDLAAVSIRVTDGSHQAVKTTTTGEVPFLYVSCVRDGAILWNNAARIPVSIYEQIARGREPRPGLILYTAVGSFGHAALVTDDRPFAFQRHIACVLPNEDRIAPRYLVQWLNCVTCRAHAERVAVGNAQKSVTLGTLREYPIPLPPVDEQLRIASALECIDARRAVEVDARRELGRVKSALMSVLLNGEVRVTPDEVAA